jgi:hypothetical protein
MTGGLVCDASEFEGYCTVEDCVPNECPNNAACVLFNPAVPGCAPNDRLQGSRISQQFCMAGCSTTSNCRDGYECVNPTLPPWNAVILDNNQDELVCIPMPLETSEGGDAASASQYDPDAAVCQVVGPAFDANFPLLDASDAMTDGTAAESSVDATRSGD